MTRLHRPHMPLSVKYEACLRLVGVEPGMRLQERIDAILRHVGLDPACVQFDHDPALGNRDFDRKAKRYTPEANDPAFIVPREIEDHKDKTRGDVKQMASRRRSEKALELKIDTQAARLERGRQILAKTAAGEPVEKDMRPPEKRKAKAPMPGSRDSKYKRKMNGETVLR